MEYRPEEVAGVFGRAADTYDTVIPFFARFGTRLVEVADLQPGEAVLDVGSGRGATLLPAAAAVGPAGRVLGVDLSEQMVARLHADIGRHRLTNASVRRMDAEALDVEAGAFDVALCSFVLHLLPHPQAAAAAVRRAVRTGGRLVASVPAGTGEHWAFLMRLFRSYAPRATRPSPVPFRPDFDLAAVVGSAGFQIRHSFDESIDFSFDDEDAWWEWAWSAGMRGFLETLAAPDLEDLRREALGEVAALGTPEGVPLRQVARFVVAD